MRILDIDLDAFLHEVLTFVPPETRPAIASAPPWDEAEVAAFLEVRCGLSASDPIECVLVDEHDEVLDIWLSEAERGILVPPLDVVHVDAHADMGLGSAGWMYLLTELLHLPLEARARQLRPSGRTGLTPGNFLAYAAACGILGSVTYTYPSGGGDDGLPYLFRNHSSKSGAIELPRYPLGTPSNVVQSPRHRPTAVEPAIPYRSVPMCDYESDAPFDRAYVCRSPEYVPAEAEELLMDVLIQYMQL